MFILHFHIRGTSIYGSIKKGGMYEDDASIHKENDTKSIASAASKNTAKKAESVKSKQNTSKSASTKPVKYSQTTIKNVQPIAGVGLVEIDIDDVVFYNENIDKYKKEKDEKLIPFIVRLNESFKKDALTRQRSKKYKHIAYWGFALLFVGVIIFILYLCYGWISSLWK